MLQPLPRCRCCYSCCCCYLLLSPVGLLQLCPLLQQQLQQPLLVFAPVVLPLTLRRQLLRPSVPGGAARRTCSCRAAAAATEPFASRRRRRCSCCCCCCCCCYCCLRVAPLGRAWPPATGPLQQQKQHSAAPEISRPPLRHWLLMQPSRLRYECPQQQQQLLLLLLWAQFR